MGSEIVTLSWVIEAGIAGSGATRCISARVAWSRMAWPLEPVIETLEMAPARSTVKRTLTTPCSRALRASVGYG